MSHQKRVLWLGLAGLGAAAWLGAQYAPPTGYTVTEVNSMMGAAVTMQINRDGSKAAIDNSNGKTRMRAVYDLAAGTSVSWDLDNPSNGCGVGTFSGDWGDPFVSADVDEMLKNSTKPPGAETVNGIATKVYEGSDPGSNIKIKVWREPRTGLIVKADMTPPGAAATTVVEVKQYSPVKPDAAIFAVPAGCMKNGAPMKFQTAEDKFAGEVGGAAADYADATRGPGSPDSCTMLLRMVDASMQPLTNFQVALDLQVDSNNPAHYVMGGSPSGRTVFSGGHLKEYTDQVRGGVLRLENVPDHFDMEVTFAGGNKGASSAMLYRHCAGPQSVLLFVVKNPDKVGEGADWMWAKSGKFAGR